MTRLAGLLRPLGLTTAKFILINPFLPQFKLVLLELVIECVTSRVDSLPAFVIMESISLESDEHFTAGGSESDAGAGRPAEPITRVQTKTTRTSSIIHLKHKYSQPLDWKHKNFRVKINNFISYG